MSVPAGFGFAKLTQIGRSLAQGWVGIGEQAAFYVKSLVETGEVLAKYRLELLRLVAQMSLGVGALALIGGAVMVVSFIVMNAGALVGIVGYSQLNDVGIEALVGFFAAYVNPRLVAPLITSVGLAATVGAGATAQIGAMRINEEIDALEVMGIRSIAYLVSTRVLAGVIVVIPLFCLSAILTNLASRAVVQYGYGQSVGVYDHYFKTFLQPTDMIWAFLQVLLQGTVIMLVHTYYGYTAAGGPAGVGEATGRAVRTSLIVATMVTLIAGLILYGRSGNFNLSG
jgi:phospholipid/cholesterol/gamma-HCH transport system permease protein